MNNNVKEEITQKERSYYVDDNLNDMEGILMPDNAGSEPYIVHSDEWIRSKVKHEIINTCHPVNSTLISDSKTSDTTNNTLTFDSKTSDTTSNTLTSNNKVSDITDNEKIECSELTEDDMLMFEDEKFYIDSLFPETASLFGYKGKVYNVSGKQDIINILTSIGTEKLAKRFLRASSGYGFKFGNIIYVVHGIHYFLEKDNNIDNNFYLDNTLDKAKYFGYRDKVYNISDLQDIIDILTKFEDNSLKEFLEGMKHNKNIVIGSKYFINHHVCYSDLLYMSFVSTFSYFDPSDFDKVKVLYNNKKCDFGNRLSSDDIDLIYSTLRKASEFETADRFYDIIDDKRFGTDPTDKLLYALNNTYNNVINDIAVINSFDALNDEHFYINEYWSKDPDEITRDYMFGYKGKIYMITEIQDILNILNHIGGIELAESFNDSYKKKDERLICGKEYFEKRAYNDNYKEALKAIENYQPDHITYERERMFEKRDLTPEEQFLSSCFQKVKSLIRYFD